MSYRSTTSKALKDTMLGGVALSGNVAVMTAQFFS
jgi:hypothetical protein